MDSPYSGLLFIEFHVNGTMMLNNRKKIWEYYGGDRYILLFFPIQALSSSPDICWWLYSDVCDLTHGTDGDCHEGQEGTRKWHRKIYGHNLFIFTNLVLTANHRRMLSLQQWLSLTQWRIPPMDDKLWTKTSLADDGDIGGQECNDQLWREFGQYQS